MRTTVARTPQVRKLGAGLAIAALAAILAVTLVPNSEPPRSEHFCLICGTRGGVDAVLNVLLFMPMGLGLGLAGVRATRAIASMATLSAVIEAAQFFFISGRDATIGDVLTNAVGGALGFFFAVHIGTLIFPARRKAVALAMSWSATWIVLQIISSYGFAAAIPRSQYYGQLARRLGDFEVFRGKVLSASVGNEAVADGKLLNTAHIRELLQTGAELHAVFTAAKGAGRLSPIVRIADDQQREVALLAQNREGLVYGVRTGANTLGLRPPFFAFALASANGAAVHSPGQPVAVTSQYTPRQARFALRDGGGTTEKTFPIAESLAWTMLLPFQWFIAGTTTEALISAIWVAVLALPFGYWGFGAASVKTDQLAISALAAAALIALMYLGLAVVPVSFGLAVPAAGVWVEALVGVLSGGAAARSLGRRRFGQAKG